MSQEKQFCRNCGKRDLAFSQEGTVRFWEPGLCAECHRLPIIITRYDVFTGERIEPAPKHDGKLGEDDDYEVSFDDKQVFVSDGYDAYIYLDPKQALSLLAWLREQEATLEQLAKEHA